MENPKVLKKMTKKARKWKKTYGFDYVAIVTREKRGGLNGTSCLVHCLKAEQEKFAKDCKKKGGFFKCCLNKFELKKYEDLRKKLQDTFIQKKRLLPKDSYYEYTCGDQCDICTATHICSTKIIDDYSEHEFETVAKNPIGGYTKESTKNIFLKFILTPPNLKKKLLGPPLKN